MNMPSTHNAPHMKKAGAAAALVVTLSLAGIPAALATNESSDSVPSATAATKAAGGSVGPGAHAAGSAAAVASQKHETAEYEKTEVIYGTLAANGKMENARVVNKFAVASGGGIVDYGMYSAVRTMTQDTDLFSAKGSTSFTANKGTFYYQGEAPHLELPWNYKVIYTLKGTNSRGEQVDGWEVSAAELAGATGTVGIHLTSTENPQANPDYYKSLHDADHLHAEHRLL